MRLKFELDKKRKAYTLLEMIVTLVLTSIIMLALITLVSTILRVSAITHNRSKTREDLNNFVQEFEKDLRNASRVGKCEGSNEQFVCEIYTNALYRWTACDRELPPLCDTQDTCTEQSAQYTKTMCKYAVSGSGNVLISKFDELYNLEEFGVQVIAEGDLVAEQEGGQAGQDGAGGQTEEATSSRRIIAFTAVASHPNARLGIENIIRQSFVSTKNFETIIKKETETNP